MGSHLGSELPRSHPSWPMPGERLTHLQFLHGPLQGLVGPPTHRIHPSPWCWGCCLWLLLGPGQQVSQAPAAQPLLLQLPTEPSLLPVCTGYS